MPGSPDCGNSLGLSHHLAALSSLHAANKHIQIHTQGLPPDPVLLLSHMCSYLDSTSSKASGSHLHPQPSTANISLCSFKTSLLLFSNCITSQHAHEVATSPSKAASACPVSCPCFLSSAWHRGVGLHPADLAFCHPFRSILPIAPRWPSSRLPLSGHIYFQSFHWSALL